MRLENSFILIPGFGQKTEQKLWQKGVHHWDTLENSSEVSSRKQEKASEFLTKARRNLEVGNTQFFGNQLPNKSIWRMYNNFQDNACFFDIETTGLDRRRNKVTTVSFYRNGESKTLVRGQDLTEENLRQEIHDSSIFVSFNGKRFDQPFLEHSFDIQMQKPHLDLMYIFKRLGLTGGLKQIEKDLGVDRDHGDVDGREAVRLWKKYENNGNEDALRKLVEYNQYDAENLQQLLQIAHGRLRFKVFEPYRQLP
jgi:uncharacterized protein YprB with RNaseH-like and TPR domain